MNHRQITLSVLPVLATIVGTSFAARVTPVDCRAFYDANDRFVGVNNSGGDHVQLDVDGGAFNLGVVVLRNELQGGTGRYYLTPDCSGPWYIVVGPISESLVGDPSYAIAAPGKTVYVRDPLATPRTLFVQAIAYQDPTCRPFSSGFDYANLVEAIPLIDLDAEFTPPFRAVLGCPDPAKPDKPPKPPKK